MARIGYWNDNDGIASDFLINEITANGHTAVPLSGLTADELAGIDTLYLVNRLPAQTEWTMEPAEVNALEQAVAGGMGLVVFDGGISGADDILPGAADIQFIDEKQVAFANGEGVDGDEVDDPFAALSGFEDGYVNLSSLPSGAEVYATKGDGTQVLAFSYDYGDGKVFYSTIDLTGLSNADPKFGFDEDVAAVVGVAIDEVTNTDPILGLTESEENAIRSLWDAASQVKDVYAAFADNYLAAQKALIGQKDSIPLADLKKNVLCQLQVNLYDNALPGEQLAMDEVLKAAGEFNDLEALLEHLNNQKLLGLKVGSILDGLGFTLDALTLAHDAYTAVNAALNNDNDEAFGTTYDLAAGLVAGKAVSLTLASGTVATAITGVAGVGLGAVIVAGGVAIAIGAGATLTLAAINKELSLVERIAAGFESAPLKLIQTQQEGWYGAWFDNEPRTITGDFLVFGGGGNDSLTGGVNEDVIVGSRGNDTLDGGAGADELRGGAGADVYYVDDPNDRVVERLIDWLGLEIDTVYSSVNYTLGRSLDVLILEGKQDINGTGNKLDNQVNGNRGDNVLSDGKGQDVVAGLAGKDTIEAAVDGDRDIFRGGVGEDLFKLDDDRKALSVNLADNKAIIGGRIDKIFGFENVEGGRKRDVLTGDNGANTLWGMGNRDRLDGAGGKDVLIGGAGRDTLLAGLDKRADTFVFEAASDINPTRKLEEIQQFDLNRDRLDFSAIDANTAISGDQAFTFSSEADLYSIWLKQLKNGDIRILGDLDGDAKKDFGILLTDLHDPDGFSPVDIASIFIL